MQADLAVVHQARQAAALIDPARARILDHLRDPDSAAGTARALKVPRQRLGYHVRELESAGLLRPVGERKVRNAVERLLQSTARRYVISPAALGRIAVSPDAIRDRFSSEYLVATGARIVQDVAALQTLAAGAGKTLPTLTIETEVRFASAHAQHEFATALADAVTKLVAEYHDERAPHGRPFRFVVAGHPSLPPTKRGAQHGK